MVVTTVSLAVGANRRIGLSFQKLLILFASWLVWAGVCVAIDSHNTMAIECAALAMLAMAWAQFTLCRDSRALSIHETIV
jgi:uncharacterized membrane protein YoaK (UPF0700 family)